MWLLSMRFAGNPLVPPSAQVGDKFLLLLPDDHLQTASAESGGILYKVLPQVLLLTVTDQMVLVLTRQ